MHSRDLKSALMARSSGSIIEGNRHVKIKSTNPWSLGCTFRIRLSTAIL